MLGACQLSVLPPTIISCISPDGFCEPMLNGFSPPSQRWAPLLVFVNTKSGDGRRGSSVLRRCKQLLNPLQVYDLVDGGVDFA